MEQIDDLIFKGKSFLEEGKFDDALGCFEQAIFLNQNDPELWNFMGVTLRSLGRYEESLECFNKSLELDPRDKFAS
ncbi:MAG: tetratricopeptide repeat protein [Nitrosopumilus sp.]|jgi:tetratricopeptide (TPR) repeat protein|nr:tetratricopeptide repeat protein [Nitrosopumilus sp.]MDH3501740.1 tetratricopeptide repeat protein [Nitrosopumilus sp.]